MIGSHGKKYGEAYEKEECQKSMSELSNNATGTLQLEFGVWLVQLIAIMWKSACTKDRH